MNRTRRTILQSLATLPMGALIPTAFANNWPGRQPIIFVNPFSAGGATDTLSRIYAEHMSPALKGQMIVDNRTGAGGTVGLGTVERSRPDGYTLGMATNGTHVFAKVLLPQMPYDTDKGFTYMAGLWDLPNVLVVHPSVPANTIPELIELLKKSPGKHNFASAGVGTSTHIAAEIFAQTADIKMTHIPYRGGAPANLDLIAGVVDMYFDNITGSMANIATGLVKPLGVTSLKRNPALPNVPSIAEFLPGYELTSWTAVAGPAGIPTDITKQIESATLEVLGQASLLEKFAKLGATPFKATGAQVKERMDNDERVILPTLRKMKLQANQ